MCSSQKLSKYVRLWPFTYRTIQLSSYWFVLIKIYCICLRCYLRKIICWKSTIKCGFILIKSLYLKISQRMSWHWKYFSALIVPASTLIASPPKLIAVTLLPANIFSKKAALEIPNKILRNSPFCSFNSFSVVLITHFYQ